MQSAKSIYTAKRHANTLAEALPLLKDKVNICDLVTITGIKIFYPKLYEIIRVHCIILVGLVPEELDDELKQKLQVLKVKFDTIIDWYDEENDNGIAIKEMLILLFPRLNVTYKGIPQMSEHYHYCVEKKRICSDKHYNLYFSIQYKTL